jgi:hypothetical protein
VIDDWLDLLCGIMHAVDAVSYLAHIPRAASRTLVTHTRHSGLGSWTPESEVGFGSRDSFIPPVIFRSSSQ